MALVGYTNAGKSTLLRALTGADVYVANQLFATLDPTTRRVDLPSGRNILLTDTVGFIQKLPTTLIAAFRATLEEITEATLLLHVVDATHPNVLQHIETVEDTLAEIEMPSVPRILVWNKIDLLPEEATLPAHDSRRNYIAEVMISAEKRTNMDGLLDAVEKGLTATLYRVKLLLPFDRGDLVSFLYDNASVEDNTSVEDGVLLHVQMPATMYERFKDYRVTR